MRLLKIILAVGLILFSSLALAHMGYDPKCCSDQHCHPIPCEELIESGKTILYKSLIFSGDMIKQSTDAFCHVCVANNPGFQVPLCVYTQQGS